MSNLKPAPFRITPSIVRQVLGIAASGAKVAFVPVLPIKLVDMPAGTPVQAAEGPVFVGMDLSSKPDISVEAVVDHKGTIHGFKREECSAGDETDRSDGGGADIGFPKERAGGASRTVGVVPRQDGISRRPRSERPTQEIDILRADRREQIRIVAERRASEQAAKARLPLGAPVTKAALAPSAPLPFEQRRVRLEAAIKFLKARCILVSVLDRDAQVRLYRVSGKAESKLAEEVIEIAIAKGFAPDA